MKAHINFRAGYIKYDNALFHQLHVDGRAMYAESQQSFKQVTDTKTGVKKRKEGKKNVVQMNEKSALCVSLFDHGWPQIISLAELHNNVIYYHHGSIALTAITESSV